MKAALLKKVGKLTLTDVKKPKCKPDGILVKVMACAVCRTDVKMIQAGHRDLILPRILGHEVSGVIAEAGRKVKYFKEGDKIQIAPGISCGRCPYCIKGIQNMCDNMSIIGFHYDGGFAEYMLLPLQAISSGCISKISNDLTFEEAALAEPIACCINALDVADFKSGESIAIWGAGFMGALFIQLANVYGASRIITIENDPRRIGVSKKFSESFYVNNSIGDPIQKIRKLTQGTGVDVAIITCSSEEAPVQAIRFLSKRGRIVFFSGLKEERKNILIDHNLIHYKELKIIGAYGCTSQQNHVALKLLSKGRVKVDSLITHRINLDEIEKGIEITGSHAGTKVVICYKD